MSFRIAMVIIGVVLGAVFMLQNTLPVSIVFISWRFESPLWITMLLTFALGAGISALLFLPTVVKRGFEQKRHKRRITELEQQSSALSDQVKKARAEAPSQDDTAAQHKF
jgi:uncharacterized integral membrane protein